MSVEENNDPYRVSEHSDAAQDPGELRTPGPLAVFGIVIVSLGVGFAGFAGTCLGGFLASDFLSSAGIDNIGAGLLLTGFVSMAVGLWLMITVSRALYRFAARLKGRDS